MNDTNTEKRKDKSGQFMALIILGPILTIILAIAICGFGTTLFTSFFWEDTRAIEGDGSAYDPIDAYDSVSAYAGENAQLISLEAYYVRSDGTLDLYAEYYPRVDYDFYVEVSSEAGNDIPVGAPNSTGNADVLYQAVSIAVWHPNQMRSVSTSRSYSYMHLGMERDISQPQRSKPSNAVPAPACHFADLWATAIEKNDAPADAVAIIRYNAQGYNFSISDTDIRMQFGFDCEWED